MFYKIKTPENVDSACLLVLLWIKCLMPIKPNHQSPFPKEDWPLYCQACLGANGILSYHTLLSRSTRGSICSQMFVLSYTSTEWELHLAASLTYVLCEARGRASSGELQPLSATHMQPGQDTLLALEKHSEWRSYCAKGNRRQTHDFQFSRPVCPQQQSRA